MQVKATITCECGCIFEAEFQNSKLENAPVCPQCKKQMDSKSWESLRDLMARYADFNHHIVKWSLERQEPRMEVPAITVRTL